MKIVYISRSDSGSPWPFVTEQADVLKRNYNIEIEHFLIKSGGLWGYSIATRQLYGFLRRRKTDIIHIHYGLFWPLAVLNRLLIRKYKMVITFHGSDINIKSHRVISLLGTYFSAHNILVSEKMAKYFKRKYSVVPCGIDIDIELNLRESTRRSNGWGKHDFIVLFSSSFNRTEKDPGFALSVIDQLSKLTTKSVKLIELKGYKRKEITELMQAADALMMCSLREGSPQIIKEAILNSLPIVSNDVGDVKSICAEIDNCYVIPKVLEEYVKCFLHLSEMNSRIQNRRPIIERFDNNIISKKLFNIYKAVLNEADES